jgi:hypothetical protein
MTLFKIKNKKVYFSDNDSSPSDEEVIKTTKKLKSATLFSDDDDENNDNLLNNEKIDFKSNLNEEKASKLLDLKTKYANDSRFKIDERFIESDDDQQVIESNEIDDEKEKSFRILEEITGKIIRREFGVKKTKLDNDKTQNEPRMVRYDPTKEEHRVFEASKETLNNEKVVKIDSNETNTNSEEPQKSLVDETKFYEVHEDIKSRICSNEVFKFKFGGDDEKELKETKTQNDSTQITRTLARKPLDFLNKDLNVNDSSSEDDYDDEQQHREEINEDENRTIEESHNFLPLLSDTRIKEALEYFIRPKKLHELREEWKNQREKLVDEYKKKHSRAVRNQRKKDSEKKLPWKNIHLKKSSNKTKK